MRLFVEDDVREFIRNLPPKPLRQNTLPPLILSSDGLALLTLESLEDGLQRQILNGTERLSVNALAKRLHVDEDIVVQLVQNDAHPRLHSLDKNHIVPQSEYKALEKIVTGLLVDGFVSKSDISTRYDLDTKSVEALLHGLGTPLAYFSDHVCSESYRDIINTEISKLVETSLKELRAVTIEPENLPGHPPIWFVSQNLEKVLEKDDTAQKFFKESGDQSIRCVPRQLVEQARDKVFDDLHSGALPYIGLRSLAADFPEIYTFTEEAQQHVGALSNVKIIEEFAVSGKWIENTIERCWQTLEKDGIADLSQRLDSRVPTSVKDHIVEQVVRSASSATDSQPTCLRDFIILDSRLQTEYDALRSYAAADADAQWKQLKQNPDKEIKFQLTNITDMLGDSGSVLKAVVETKPAQKILEGHFWVVVSERESENEAEFATFWTERVVSRCLLYKDGLDAIEDVKLREQIAELTASFMQKELIPDNIAKAKSLGLVLSRKTRKSLEKFEAKLQLPEQMDIPSLISSLDRFNSKEGIETPTISALEEAKSTMVQDMKRRMQKQRKSDGPVLFLTLVILLFASRYAGVVYATGKFAPKLLKQLKANVSEEEYGKLEGWKEAAKTNALSAEDREEMKRIVGA